MITRMYQGINLDELGLIGLDDEEVDCLCQWFMHCTTEAIGYRHHPTLGDVPICQSCAELMHRLSK